MKLTEQFQEIVEASSRSSQRAAEDLPDTPNGRGTQGEFKATSTPQPGTLFLYKPYI
jgi:hypothetical protein